MTDIHDAWLARQRARWLRPNAHLFMRPDAHRFLRPDWKRYVPPGFEPLHLSLLEGKANFNPDQPRVPKGNPDGGQWTDEGGGGGTGEGGGDGSGTEFSGAGIGHNQGPPLEEPPAIPPKQPSTKKEQNAHSKATAHWIAKARRAKHPIAALMLVVEAVRWFDEHQRASIISYQDPPGELDELRVAATRESQKGYENHHIRMQKPAEDDGFPDSMIHSPENIVRIPYWKHREITGWFNTRNEDAKFKGRTPAEYLRGKSWEERLEVGLEALRLHGVLK